MRAKLPLNWKVSVLPGIGGGLFNQNDRRDYSVGATPNSICAEDFTGDGRVEERAQGKAQDPKATLATRFSGNWPGSTMT